jgi:hypothetical protein
MGLLYLYLYYKMFGPTIKNCFTNFKPPERLFAPSKFKGIYRIKGRQVVKCPKIIPRQITDPFKQSSK